MIAKDKQPSGRRSYAFRLMRRDEEAHDLTCRTRDCDWHVSVTSDADSMDAMDQLAKRPEQIQRTLALLVESSPVNVVLEAHSRKTLPEGAR